ncbi:hypothetical protein HF1_04460 [Mycoplasma haemofelis str. Langford 1]|uniref:Uncharacterized protein n=1 Tax=Mycoplasma haemofelis (strain Langford 1) TaxID=941640 RepID=E8ZH33_MYCHL|nr:hypothetical protein [Mycoplasma haemofelis]CBY92454.1 hypothetical protein HF1_04460 [Mycoplasma haemofelis str. Langford 1]
MVSKAGMAAAGALGAGTAVYAGYEYVLKSKDEIKKVTIGEEWESFLLSTETSDKWSSRATRLSSADDNSLVKELQSLKPKTNQEHLKNWCSQAATKTYSEATALYLANVRSYCTFYIEDKLPEGYIKASEEWSGANERLKGVNPDTDLSEQMKAIKGELTKQGNTNNDALKNWCSGVYVKPFLGEDNQDFKDAKSYCSKVAASTSSTAPQA